ncbi:MAG: HEAT repeat domain-containing protein [Bdellovibrionota bacterium]
MTDNKNIEKPKSPAASHMLWFFLLPAFGFLGWATYQLVNGMANKKPESSLVEKARAIEKGRSDGDRWKAAYALAEELLKKSKEGTYQQLPQKEKSEILSALTSLIKQHKDDIRLKKYLILTTGRLGDKEALPLLRTGLTDADADLRFYSGWGYLETLSANPESIQDKDKFEIRSWLDREDNALKKIATSFLVQHDPEALPKVVSLLKDKDKEVQWNTAVALSSVGKSEGKEKLKEIFVLQNLRDFGFRSAKDMEQLLKAAKVAALKLDDKDVLAKMETLKKSANLETPEGKAIKNAL